MAPTAIDYIEAKTFLGAFLLGLDAGEIDGDTDLESAAAFIREERKHHRFSAGEVPDNPQAITDYWWVRKMWPNALDLPQLRALMEAFDLNPEVRWTVESVVKRLQEP